MRLHIKNILAGVGTGAVVVLLAVLSIMSFASVSQTEVDARITIIKDVVPNSEHNTNPHSNIEFQFNVSGFGGSNYGQILDDDGVEPVPNQVPADTEPSNTWIINAKIPEGGSLVNISESFDDSFEYNTEIQCFYDQNEGDKTKIGHSFGTSVEVSLEPLKGNANITCIFINTLTDATLIVNKDIIPDSSDTVDINIFTPNDNEHANGYDYFTIGDGGTHTTKIATVDENRNPIIYTVSEALGRRATQDPQFYSKYTTRIECTNANTGVVTISDNPYIDLPPFASGDVVTCNILNTKNAEVQVKKVVNPDPGNNNEGFDFNINTNVGQGFSSSFNLSHGESETFYVRNGWQETLEEKLNSEQNKKYRTSFFCDIFNSDGSYRGNIDSERDTPGEHRPKIELSPGVSETYKCVFTNHLHGLTIKKVVQDKDNNEITNDESVFNIKNLTDNTDFDLDVDPNSQISNENKVYYTTGQDYTFEENRTNDQKLLYDTSYSCVDKDGNEVKKGNGAKFTLSGLTQDDKGIICTFINKQADDAQIIITKYFRPVDDDDVAIFSIQPANKKNPVPENINLHSDRSNFRDVRPGTYRIQELIEQKNNNPYKSYFTDYSCTFTPARSPNILTTKGAIIDIPDLKGGERVHCIVNNKEAVATITIKKDVVGSDGSDITDDTSVFNFRNYDNTNFDLDDNPNQSPNSDKTMELQPGTYSFAELLTDAQKLLYEASFKCIDDNTKDVVLEGQDGDINNLNLERHQSVTCTITNTKSLAKITIKKDVRGSDGSDITDDQNVFQISNDTDVIDFDLDDNTSQAPESEKTFIVNAGKNYSFTEKLTSAQDGDYSVEYSCNNNTSGTGKIISISGLPKNGDIICTFINKKLLTRLIIKKDIRSESGVDITNDPEVFSIENATDNKDFEIDDFAGINPPLSEIVISDIVPGKSYTLLEDLTDAQRLIYTPSWSCTDGSSSASGIVYGIKVKKGDTVTCTILNKKKEFNQKVIVKKVTVPAGASEIFPIRFKDKAKNSSEILRLKDGQSTTRIVPSNSNYGLEEIISPGHPVNSYSCKYIPGNSTYKPFSGNGKIIPDFFLPKGHDIECTFKNCKNGLLCPLIGDPNDPNPTGGGTSVVGGGGTGGGGNQ